jgi:hypothetical protein
MSDAIISVGAFVVATVLLSVYSWKQKQKGWIGVVEDKKIKKSTDEDGFDHESYTVIFRTESGKKIKFGVASKAGLETFEMGKRYEKKPGSYIPEKVEH